MTDQISQAHEDPETSPQIARSEAGEAATWRRLLRPEQVPWRRLFFEFFAIFSAVLLSFIAEDWRKERVDRRSEAQLLQGLLQDLETDTLFFGRGTIPVDSVAAAAGEWLQANWRRSGLPVDSIGLALNEMYRGMAYAPARTEYESARNSARLDLLQSPELRRQINAHFEQTHGILEDVWALNWHFHFEWAKLLRPYVDFAPSFRGPILLTPETFNQGLWPQASLGVSWSRMQADRELYAMLAQTNTFRRLSVAWQRANLAEIHSLRRSIMAELDAR